MSRWHKGHIVLQTSTFSLQHALGARHFLDSRRKAKTRDFWNVFVLWHLGHTQNVFIMGEAKSNYGKILRILACIISLLRKLEDLAVCIVRILWTIKSDVGYKVSATSQHCSRLSDFQLVCWLFGCLPDLQLIYQFGSCWSKLNVV